MRRQRVDITELHHALDGRRCRRGIAWVDVARETHLAAPIFTRLAAGRGLTADGYVTLCKWLDEDMPYTKDVEEVG